MCCLVRLVPLGGTGGAGRQSLLIREWANVRIADDFAPPKDSGQHDANDDPIPGPIDDGEARLAYVAVTRTRHCLDLGGLSWIHSHPDGNPQTQ